MAISESKLKQMNSKSIMRYLETADKLSKKGLVEKVVAILENARKCAEKADDDAVRAFNRKKHIIKQKAYVTHINTKLEYAESLINYLKTEILGPNLHEKIKNADNVLGEINKYAIEGELMDGKFDYRTKIKNLEYELDGVKAFIL